MSHLLGTPSPRATAPLTAIISPPATPPSRALPTPPIVVLWRVRGWIFWEEAPLPHQAESQKFWCALMTRAKPRTVVDWFPRPPPLSTGPGKKCPCHLLVSGAPPPESSLLKLKMTSKSALSRRVPPSTHVPSPISAAGRESQAPFQVLGFRRPRERRTKASEVRHTAWGNGVSGRHSQWNSQREWRVREFCDFNWEGR